MRSFGFLFVMLPVNVVDCFIAYVALNTHLLRVPCRADGQTRCVPQVRARPVLGVDKHWLPHRHAGHVAHRRDARH
jgi:hypothetical protein